MADIRCKMCGGSVVLSADMEVSICDSCGTAAVLPEHIRQQLREERETREKKERAIAEAIAEQGIAEEQAKLKEQKEREEKELQRLIQHEYSRYPVLRFLGYLIVFALCAFLAVWLVFIITTGNNYDLSETLLTFPPITIFAHITLFFAETTSGFSPPIRAFISSIYISFIPFIVVFAVIMAVIPALKVAIVSERDSRIAVIITTTYTIVSYLVSCFKGSFAGFWGYVLGFFAYYIVGMILYAIGAVIGVNTSAKTIKRLKERIN